MLKVDFSRIANKHKKENPKLYRAALRELKASDHTRVPPHRRQEFLSILDRRTQDDMPIVRPDGSRQYPFAADETYADSYGLVTDKYGLERW